jgi:pantoate--beta-alanine ligase
MANTPPIVRTVADLRAEVAAWRAEGERIALVPTMGGLHAGHLSLIERARAQASRIVASVFVNPTQFGPTEDFAAYPRDEAADAAMLGAAGCDLMYAPGMDAIYPAGFATRVSVEGLTESMEGALRPGHFTGVATVVAKLLIQGAPDVAVFGEKDFQQLAVIRRLVADLDLPVEIVAAPIVRAEDGLALSSRNAYLTPEQRRIAPALHRALNAAAAAMAAGQAAHSAEQSAMAALRDAGFDAVDYVETRDPASLARLGPGPLETPARLLAVARLGHTRLLDNVAVRV